MKLYRIKQALQHGAWLAACLLVVHTAVGQTACEPALAQYATHPRDTTLVDQLIEQATEFRFQQPSCAILFAERAVGLADSLRYSSGAIRAHEELAILYDKVGRYYSAHQQLDRAWKLARTHGQTNWEINYYYTKGVIQTNQANYTEAYHNLLHSIDLARTHKNHAYHFQALLKAGQVQEQQKEYAKAKELYDQAVALASEQGLESRLGDAYISLGTLQAKQGDMVKALDFFSRSEASYAAAKNNEGLSYAYNNQAAVYRSQGDNQRAERFYLKSLQIKSDMGNQSGMATSYNNLGDFYYYTNQDAKALEFFQRSLAISLEIGASSTAMQAYHNLSVVHKANKRYLEAYEQFRSYTKLKDSIFNEKKSEQIAEMRIQFETAEKEHRIQLLDTQVRQSRLINYLALAIVVSLLLAIGAVVRAYVLNRRSNRLLREKNEQIERRDKEKAMLLRELNHRVKNNLQIVSSLLNIQSHRITDEAASEAVREGKLRIEAMSLIHQKLYGERYYTKIDLREYLNDLISNLLNSFGKPIDLQLEVESVIVDIDQTTPLALIINELITNVIKYAYPNTEHPSLVVAAQRQGRQLQLSISDNGPGFGADFSAKPNASFGLRLIESLTRQLDGQISYFNHEGGGVRQLIFPLKEQSHEAQS